MNSNSSLTGVLMPFIIDLLNMRRNLGFKSEAPRYSLLAFNAFALRKGLTNINISKELAEEWCSRRPDEATDTWSHRNCFLRQFSIYLVNLGYNSYVPPRVFGKCDNFIPYIFSDQETKALFEACDSLVLFDKHARSEIIVMPTLIRMLFSTGIRVGEAASLINGDVDLDHNYLILRNCKNGKDRMVPISESLAETCRQYRKYRTLLPDNSDHFFVKLNGCKCLANSFYLWWSKLLKTADIKRRGKVAGPRLQDIRHTFCVKSMAQLAKEGKDLYYILPILSTYVGHQSLAATDRYLRLTSQMYPELFSQTDSICSYIFPELKYRPND